MVEEFWTQLDKESGGLENWTIFMEAISVSSLMFLTLEEVHLKIHQAVACKSSRENFIGAFDIW